MQAYDNLKALVAAVEPDLAKAEAGNKAAGTRVRKSMQDIKKAAQEVRQAVLELREAPETPAAPGAPQQ
jgi:signal transduction histidine kinase